MTVVIAVLALPWELTAVVVCGGGAAAVVSPRARRAISRVLMGE